MRFSPSRVSIPLLLLLAVIGLAAASLSGTHVAAQSATTHYLILARGQGNAATDPIRAAAPTVGTAKNVRDATAEITVDSSDPNFATSISPHSGVQNFPV